MTRDRHSTDDGTTDDGSADRPAGNATPACAETGCGDDASFYRYDPESRDWRGVCASHARQVHPSLEVHAWLESGYMKPAELGRPAEPPTGSGGGTDPVTGSGSGRREAFRAVVEEAMGWSE